MSFDISRLRRADQLVGGGAIALFIFMFFFKWFGGSVSGALPTGAVGSASNSSTGWDTFTNSRWIWLITIIVALGSVVMVAGEKKLDAPVSLGAIVTGLGALSTLLIFYRIVHHPSDSVNFGTFHASYGIKVGIWLGLIAALVITYGGYLQMQQEGAVPAASEPTADASSGVTVATAGASSPSSTAETTSLPAPPASPVQPPITPPGPGGGEEPPTAPGPGSGGGEDPPTAPGG
jgi:hypothetical protein